MSITPLIGNTPLIALERIGRDLPVPVLVKCEHLNPGELDGPVVTVLGAGWPTQSPASR